MDSHWGRQIVYSLFGESHGPMIGITLHHLPAGMQVDLDAIRAMMQRRRPGNDDLSTPRKETDDVEIVSGMLHGKTTGAPLTALIKNTDRRSKDYTRHSGILRPSHADLAAHLKYGGHHDPRGGGHFSGRLTAPIAFAGALAMQILERQGVVIHTRILRIGPVLKNESDPEQGLTAEMEHTIRDARSRKDSVGGRVRVIAHGVKPGWGEPFFHSAESVLSQLYYAIPGVKGVLFGAGERFAEAYGSQVNDPMQWTDGHIDLLSNHNGGINGGITNGETITAELILKPTPSIGQPQTTVRIDEQKTLVHEIQGRHDPCIVVRALPVIEAMTAMGLLELYMMDRAGRGLCHDQQL